MRKRYTIRGIQDTLTPIFRKNQVRKAILFGSDGKGVATAQSDIDLMVDSRLKGLSFFGLMDEVCESLSCPVDLIDTQDILPGSAVDREIRDTGVVIYEHCCTKRAIPA